MILAASVILRVAAPQLDVKQPEPDSLFISQLVEIRQQLAEHEKKSSVKVRTPAQEAPGYGGLNLFAFDPNTISEDSLEMMGIPTKIIRNLMKYRQVGGRIAEPGAIAKIYGMDSLLTELLIPYIHIEPIVDEQKVAATPSTDFVEELIELNSADTIALRAIRGVGISYSRRIFQYRELLGGFYSMEQLWEVYGMDSARFIAISESCTLHVEDLRKIPLNSAGFRDLISHPYINKADTYAILQFRDFNDSIDDPEQLLENQILEPERFRKARAYLSTD
jgi:DNA uptake protein ComE-like DNA-binding protein